MCNTSKLWWAQAGEGVIVLFQLVFGVLYIKPGTLHMLSLVASLRGTLLPSIHSTRASASLGLCLWDTSEYYFETARYIRGCACHYI